jgi:hypothetical protein
MRKLKNFFRPYLQHLGILPSRINFLKILPKNAIGAELGVFQGELSEYLIKIAQPKLLYLVDPWWEIHGDFFPKWANVYNNNQRLSTKLAFERTQLAVTRAGGEDVVEYIVSDDILFLKKLPNNHLDWAYIDSTHQYQQTVMELNELNRIIKQDGIITGHDWEPEPTHRHHGVYKAVQEFCMKENWQVIRIDAQFTQWAIKRK